MDAFSFQSFDQTTYSKMLAALLAAHRSTFDQYEKFRQVKAGCYGAAKDLAGDKPVTDTYIERAVEQQYGNEVLEEGKVLFLRLQALATQIQGLSVLISSEPINEQA